MGNVAALAADVRVPSGRQALFISFTLCVLVDLTVLNLLNEYWDRIAIDSLTPLILTATVLQVLLMLTLRLEHWPAGLCRRKGGRHALTLRVFVTWLIRFGSKFAVLGTVNLLFSNPVDLGCIVSLIAVVLALFAAELELGRIDAWLVEADEQRHGDARQPPERRPSA